MAKTANEKLFDQQVRFNIDLQRYSTRLAKQFVAILNKADADLLSQIDKANPEQIDSFTNRRRQQLLNNIRALNQQVYIRAAKQLTPDLKALAVSQAALAKKAINTAVGVDLKVAAPSPELLEAVVTAQPFQGKLLSDWVDQLSDGRFGRLRDAINIGILEGQTTDQIISRIRGSRANGFRDGILDISRRDADAVVRTAVNHTVTRSRELLYEKNADLIKGIQWVSTLDSRTTAICRARDGMIFKPGDGPRPPAHVRCLPGDALVTASAGITGAFKRWYDGNLIVIRTAGGKQLACTPNHPILTRRGWVAAQSLDLSDDVVCHSGRDWVAPLVDRERENVPSSIEDVAEAVFAAEQVAVVPVPTTAEDFHGDGMDGEVAIVGANRFLAGGIYPARAQQGGKLVLRGRGVSLLMLASEGDLAAQFRRLLATANGGLRSFGQLASLIRRGTAHARELLLGSIAQLTPAGLYDSLNGSGADREALSDAAHADAGIVHRQDFSLWKGDASLPCGRTHRLGGFMQATDDSIRADAKLARDLLGGKAGAVELDNVVDIQRREFRGHVFNLETVRGWYAANGIITHNCRSTTVPVMKSWKDLGIDLEEAPDGTRASVDGQVPAEMTYGDWLKQQPRATVEDVLGAKKAALFIDGKLPIDRFVDDTGRELTLEELEAREHTAWDRAFGQ